VTTPSFFIDKDQEFLILSPITTKILLWEDDHRDAIHVRQHDNSNVDTRGLSFVFLFDYCVFNSFGRFIFNMSFVNIVYMFKSLYILFMHCIINSLSYNY
jgi:hypothetical protein